MPIYLSHPLSHPLLARLAASLLAVALALWLLLTLAAPAAAQVPATTPVTPAPAGTPTPAGTPRPAATPNPGAGQTAPGLPGVGFDPFALLGEQVRKALAELLATVIRPARDAVHQHIDRQFNVLTVTRPEHSIGLPAVQALHAAARAIANAAFALILVVGGYNLIFRRHLTGDDDELWPLLGRLLLAALAANTAIVGGGASPGGWATWFIALNNALIDAATRALPISLDGLLAAGPLDPLLPTNWPQLGAGLLLALLILAVLMLVFLLWLLQMLVRLALLDVLLALAPLAMALWVLPQTERWAGLWWRAFLPTLFCQFVQVAALGLGIALGRALGPPAEAALAPLLGIATLALVLKVPGLLSAGFGHGASLSGAAARSLALAGLARRALGRG